MSALASLDHPSVIVDEELPFKRSFLDRLGIALLLGFILVAMLRSAAKVRS